MELWQITAIEGVRKTLADYAIFTDSGQVEKFAALFARDGEFMLPDGSSIVGPEAIEALLKGHREYFANNPSAAPPGFLRHQVTTQCIDIVSETEATAESYFMTLTARSPDHWGRWLDNLIRESDGRWRFSKRIVLTEGYYADSWYANSFRKS